MAKLGEKAPDFAIPKAVKAGAAKLSDFQGRKNVVLAFYPRAFTPGCTKQLCGYRDEFERFSSADTQVLAISMDPQRESNRFKRTEAFPFPVLGDPEGRIVKTFGVPVKESGGQSYAQRSVFVIDKSGVIRYVDLNYDVVKGKEPLFAALAALSRTGRPPGSGLALAFNPPHDTAPASLRAQ